MKKLAVAMALVAAAPVWGATPVELLSRYQAQAAKQSSGFAASAQRGAEFFRRSFGVNARMPACTSCHTESPAQSGRHVVTDKVIEPLSPAANPERLSDPAKVEKWFKRNCTEVVGRECSAAEKADFIAFLLEGAQR